VVRGHPSTLKLILQIDNLCSIPLFTRFQLLLEIGPEVFQFLSMLFLELCFKVPYLLQAVFLNLRIYM